MQTSPNERHDTEQATHGATPQSHDGRVTVTPVKPGRLIRLPIVEEMTSLKKSTIYALCAAGKMPAPVRLSARAVAWRIEEIERWISERLTTRG